MILNGWKNITLICGNHGLDNSNVMQIKEYLNSKRDSAFYSCPKYISIYSKPRSDGERSCNNRLSVRDFEKMLKKIESFYDEDVGSIPDMTGYKWSDHGIEFEIIGQDGEKFIIKMLNKKATAT